MDDPGRAQLQETLTKVNDFLPEALGSNREGRLTADQAKSLERKDRSDRRLLFLVGLVAVLGVGAYLASDAVRTGPSGLLRHSEAYVGLGAGLLLMVLGLFWKEYDTDLARAEVAMVQGRGTREVNNTDDGPPTYAYTIGGIGGTRFDVNEKPRRSWRGNTTARTTCHTPASWLISRFSTLRNWRPREHCLLARFAAAARPYRAYRRPISRGASAPAVELFCFPPLLSFGY